MGLGNSRIRSSPSPRAGPQQRRRSFKRSLSGLLICGASSSSSSVNEMEDYPNDLLLNSSEHSSKGKLKSSKDSDLSLCSGADLMNAKHENETSSVKNTDPRDKGKYLSENRELVPSHQSIGTSGGHETASSSNVDQNEKVCLDGINVHSHGLREFSLDEISVENNVNEAINLSIPNLGSFVVSDSPVDFHSPKSDNISQEGTHLEFVPESQQNRQEESIDFIMVSGTNSSSELSSRESRRHSRRLFWDAFSRRNSRRFSDSIFSPEISDRLRSHDRWLLDFNGDFGSESRGSSNEQQGHSRSEIWERLRDRQPVLSSEDSSVRSGISRIVMLAEALFEVLDQIQRQPMSLSLSLIALPAPESVVESFPIKTFKKTERLDGPDDVSQCYICLSDYEEYDKIRILPCHHEYHMSCVDKWLKEIHGVCPLCRGNVREGFTEGSVSN